MDQEKETKIRQWISREINSGRATVRLAGTHKVAPKNTFQQKLDSIKTLAELEGFANRRSLYNPSLPRWTENERAAIIHKKTEMQNVRRKRK